MDEDSDTKALESAYILPKDVDSITFRSADWIREPLFEAHKGSIGLAWSIFSLRGTPNAENWPVRPPPSNSQITNCLTTAPTFIYILLTEIYTHDRHLTPSPMRTKSPSNPCPPSSSNRACQTYPQASRAPASHTSPPIHQETENRHRWTSSTGCSCSRLKTG